MEGYETKYAPTRLTNNSKVAKTRKIFYIAYKSMHSILSHLETYCIDLDVGNSFQKNIKNIWVCNLHSQWSFTLHIFRFFQFYKMILWLKLFNCRG